MINTKKQAFTLVELIVVITILAILGTIAFISLQGYSQDAKNSKVTNDISSIAQKINIRTTEKDGTTFSKLIVADNAYAVDDTLKANSGALTLSGNVYSVGTINFAELQEKQTDFQDPENNDYLFAYAAKGRFATFQVAGQIKDTAGNYQAKVTGSYYKGGTNDADGLIDDKSGNFTTTGIKTDDSLPATTGLY